MRDQHLYKIAILERGYQGDIYPLYPTGDVLEITQGQIDDDELVALRGSQASLSLLCIDEGDPYTQLFTTDAQRYMLKVWRWRRGSWIGYWQGYLSTSSYIQQYANPPYKVTLKAVDGLSLLKNHQFVNEAGVKYSGVMTISSLIAAAMSPITTMPIVYMPMPPLKPGQSGHTLDNVAIDTIGLYSLFSKDMPSCHDVLDAVLKTMGLQMFMSFGSWRCRSVASLIAYRREVDGSPINNGGKSIPLYSDDADAKGISAKSTLALLAPYKELSVTRPARTDIDDVISPTMLDPKRWAGREFATWANNSDFIRITGNVNTTRTPFAYYVMDTPLMSGDNTSINVNMDVYDLSGGDQLTGNILYLYVGLYLQRADDPHFAEWLDPNVNWDTHRDPDNPVYFWNAENEAWEDLFPMHVLIPGLETRIKKSTYRYDIAASQRFQKFTVPCPTSRLALTPLSLSATGSPRDGYKLIILLSGPQEIANERVGRLYPMEIRNPSISIPQGDIIADVEFDRAPISNEGLDGIDYTQFFADSWMAIGSGQKLEAPLLDVATGDTIRTFVAPIQRALLADVVASDVRALRSNVTRQIEGDVYVDSLIDMDAIWHDRDGRTYYTNYIKHLPHRGLDYVQLRELSTDGHNWRGPIAQFSPIQMVAGLDTSVYIHTFVDEQIIYRHDLLSHATHVIDSLSYGTIVKMNVGQCCICVIETKGEYEYAITAFDTYGNVLSRIEDVCSLLSPLIRRQSFASMCLSARFDANTTTWTLIGGDAAGSYVQMFTHDGLDLGWGTIEGSVTDFTLMPNGYSYVIEGAAGQPYISVWHNNAQHAVGDDSQWLENVKIVDANENFLVVGKSGKTSIYTRIDRLMGISDTPIMEELDTEWYYVAMNDGLILWREALGNGAKIYDARTGETHIVSADTAPAASHIWLSSDYLCVLTSDNDNYILSRMRVMPGATTAPGAIEYIHTSDGLRLLTSDDIPMLLSTEDGESGGTAEGYRLSYTGPEVERRLRLAGTAYQKPITGIPLGDIDKDAFVPIDGEGDGLVEASDLRTRLNLKILSDE